jgi:hypothetical protein
VKSRSTLLLLLFDELKHSCHHFKDIIGFIIITKFVIRFPFIQIRIQTNTRNASLCRREYLHFVSATEA